jgi:hypothetical protein
MTQIDPNTRRRVLMTAIATPVFAQAAMPITTRLCPSRGCGRGRSRRGIIAGRNNASVFAQRGGQLASSKIIAAAFSAIIAVGVLVLPDVIVGMTDASATRKPAIP